ncbi:MAG: sugar ABC transporter permease [Clostridia bacterium]|nr:sugar ABC transporter permease [Clostridia bacterium]
MRRANNVKAYKALKKRSLWQEICRYRVLWLMAMPAIIYVLLFSYTPMAGIVLAFKKYDYASGIFKSPWCGLENFKFFFKSGQAAVVTRNTFLYNIAFIFLGNFLQMITAVFLSEMRNKYSKKLAQTCIFFPYFISWVVVGAFIYNIFSVDYGVLNNILKSMGAEPVNVYTQPRYWPFIITVIDLWKGVGYGSVVYLAAISGLDTSIYEAAEIDGASLVKRVYYITMPMLRSTMITLILLGLGRVFRGNFSMFYQLVGNNGVLYNHTDVIDTFVFRTLLSSNDIGMSAAVGLYQSVLCFVFIMMANGVIKKIDDSSALF